MTGAVYFSMIQQFSRDGGRGGERGGGRVEGWGEAHGRREGKTESGGCVRERWESRLSHIPNIKVYHHS